MKWVISSPHIFSLTFQYSYLDSKQLRSLRKEYMEDYCGIKKDTQKQERNQENTNGNVRENKRNECKCKKRIESYYDAEIKLFI